MIGFLCWCLRRTAGMTSLWKGNNHDFPYHVVFLFTCNFFKTSPSRGLKTWWSAFFFADFPQKLQALEALGIFANPEMDGGPGGHDLQEPQELWFAWNMGNLIPNTPESEEKWAHSPQLESISTFNFGVYNKWVVWNLIQLVTSRVSRSTIEILRFCQKTEKAKRWDKRGNQKRWIFSHVKYSRLGGPCWKVIMEI